MAVAARQVDPWDAARTGYGRGVTTDHFAGDVAASYDTDVAEMADPAVVGPTVDLLATLAGGGAAWEMGVGTGRVALPLAARGVAVSGVDLSQSMVAQLRAKTGGDAVPVVIGDFATTEVPDRFSLVYLVFNTIMNLTTQEGQIACFANAARHLLPGGCFVVEVMVPQLRRLPPGSTMVPTRVSDTGWSFDVYDVAAQGLWSHHVDLVAGGAEAHATPFRYVWPAELDLMARLAGLRLRDRWSDWQRTPFTADSPSHVSVWEKPTDPAR